MRFDKEKWPILWALDQKQDFARIIGTVNWPYNPATERYNDAYKYLIDFWNVFKEEKDIKHYYISEPVRQLVDYEPKVFKVLEKEIRKEGYFRPFHGTITYSIPSVEKHIQNQTLIYSCDMNKDNTEAQWAIAFFMGSHFGGFAWGIDPSGGRMRVDGGVFDDHTIEAIRQAVTFAKQFLYFVDNVEIQEKYILDNKKRRIKAATGTKFKNDLPKLPIEVIDSTYYTRIVKSGVFKVSGHFRWQACGEGRKQRKYKWIQEYEKSGYTRRAKIENKDEDTTILP